MQNWRLSLGNWREPGNFPTLIPQVFPPLALGLIYVLVGKAEDNLNALGFRTLRVRYHGDVARLKLGKPEYEAATGALRTEVIECVKKAGFTYVAVDLQGYRSGAMNEVLIS